MENTAKYGRLSTGNPISEKQPNETPPPRPAGGGRPPLLVNRLISQTYDVDKLLVYPSSVKIVRSSVVASKPDTPPPVRGDISGFSDQSRRRLRFLAGNTSSRLISQFCLTYHRSTPDGSTVKKHLNAWLTNLRKRFPEVAYLWVLEFQTRGVPHFHVWLNLPSDTPGLRNILAKSWHRIAEPDSQEHFEFHNHRKNFIAWDMYSPSYLCKYLDKEGQKAVPVGFSGCGRFWGNSRGLLAIPEEITAEDLDYLCPVNHETGEVPPSAMNHVIRTLGKLHERKLKHTPWRSRVRRGLSSCTLSTCAPAFRQLRSYMVKQFLDESNLPF